MESQYKIYCNTDDMESLCEQLKNGVEVTNTNLTENSRLVELSITVKKKRGRKKRIDINPHELLRAVEDKKPVSAIATELGCTERYVWKLIKLAKERG